MALTAKALREKRAPLAKTIKDMAEKANAENRDFTAEEKPNWEKVNADYDALTRQITIAERGESVEAEQKAIVTDDAAKRGDPFGSRKKKDGGAEAAVTEEHRAMAIYAWSRAEREELSDEQLEACQIVGVNPNRRFIDIGLYRTLDLQTLQRRYRSAHPTQALDRCMDFKASLGIGPGSGAAITPPETLIRQLEINMLAYGGMRQVAETIRTASGEPLSWPTADDTTNTGVQLGEATSIGSSVDPTFGKVTWHAYKFSSKPILVSYELIQDSVFDLANVIGQMLGERLGRITNTKYTTGSGAATPKGLVTAATTFAAASATTIDSDDILKLIHAIDPAYRNGAGFMLHDQILLHLRKLKDGQGRYLWESNIQVGIPDRLAGYTLTNNQDMDSTMSSGKKTILFGQLFKYKIRSVGQIRMYRLQERYRDTDQDAFIAFIREDGNLLTAGTPPVKVLTH